MFKHLFVLILFAMALQIEASVDKDFETRVEWVKELKTFVQDLETRNPEMLTTHVGREFFLKLSLFEEAMAAGNYDCFFAGWPSKLVKSGGRRLCQSPGRGNAEYDNGSCKKGQMQCQPLMFGQGICVGFSSSKEKQLAFSSCEKKFRAKGSYDFLKTLTNDEKTALKEISGLAHEICETGSVGVQKSKPMCKSLMNKMKTAMEAVDRAPASEEEPKEEKSDEGSSTPDKRPVPGDKDYVDPVSQEDLEDEKSEDIKPVEKVDNTTSNQVIKQNDDICEVPVVVDKEVEDKANEIIATVNNDTDKLYEEIKKEFLGSALCAPEKVYNDPKDRLSPVLFTQLLDEMRFVVDSSPHLTREIKILRFKELVSRYKLSDETLAYGEKVLKEYEETTSSRFDAMARLRGVMLQDMAKVASKTEGYESESIKEGLAERGVFVYDDEGNPECPFVDKDAFRAAIAGREEVMKSEHRGEISQPNMITIVDYSRPSNQRRMYVIDLKTKKVLHNTWAAHGGGTDRSQGQGKLNPETNKYDGSSPETSNEPKSLLSSEGFYIAKSASHGDMYLNNVLLKGIDEDNDKMGKRAIVVHGWRTPSAGYAYKTWEMSEDKNPVRIPGKDVYKEFMSLDFKTTKEDLFNVTQDVRGAAAGRDYMDATDGCLGVPDTPMGHADRKGRDKSQLELLRDDLPGTLMFNYNGSKTKSKYLK